MNVENLELVVNIESKLVAKQFGNIILITTGMDIGDCQIVQDNQKLDLYNKNLSLS